MWRRRMGMAIDFLNLVNNIKKKTQDIPSKKSYFYDGQLRGDMADFSAQCLEPHWGTPEYAEEEFEDVPF